MNKKIKTTLNRLGLDKKEITIYLHLTTSTVQSIKQVADATSINRTTVYRYLDSLVDKGLVEWIIDKQGRKVQATSPDKLSLYLNEQKGKIIELENSLPKILSQLSQLHPSRKFATQVRYYQGEKGIKQMIWNTLQTQKTLRSYTPFGRREVISSKFEDKFEIEWTKKKLKDRIITNETKIEYIKKRLVPSYRKTLNIRVIPSKKYYISNDICVYNDIFSIASLKKGGLVGVEIQNNEIAKTQKSIFELIWEIAKPLKEHL